MKNEREPPKQKQYPIDDLTRLRAMMTAEPENKYTEMALLIQGQPINTWTLDRASDVEKTIQNRIRFEGRASVDMALGLVVIGHAISTMRITLGISSHADRKILELIDSMKGQT